MDINIAGNNWLYKLAFTNSYKHGVCADFTRGNTASVNVIRILKLCGDRWLNLCGYLGVFEANVK
jgi:hypothetical protein